MDKEPDNPPKSSSEPDQQLRFPSGSFGMEDANLYEFGGFSSVYSATPVFEFRSDPAPSGGVGDEVEENIGVPQPLAGLHESPVPPFLSKTYDLVNDRNLDPIISWGSTGESFVVWDPVEFSRVVLPRNFKHNNFSSFVRQLNTYVIVPEILIYICRQKDSGGEVHLLQGFRKIDSDKWEFANEAFRRGEKHLLKNIQRRRTLQAQQTVSYTGPSTRAGMTELECEIETLRKERGEMIQEVVQLQQQQKGSVHHMEAVNQRLQAAEERQKQMVSFLAKLFQNPSFIARLKQTKEQRGIGSPGTKRKYIKHRAHEQGLLESAMEGQIVKYDPEWKSHLFSSEAMASEPQTEYIPADEYAVSSELEAAQGFMNTPLQFGEGPSNLLREDTGFKGKSVMSPLQEVGLEYLVSSPMDLISEKDFPEFSSAGMESIAKQEDLWSMGFETQTGMLNPSQEMWSNIDNYDVTNLVSSGGLSDIWDLGSLQAGGSSGKWPSTEIPGNEPESRDDQTSPGK